MHVYNETMIETYLDTIAQSRSGLATPPRTPISILLDFSGSMHLYQRKAEQVVQAITTQMLGINRRVFTLVIILIYNGQSEVVYLGDLHAFDIEQWLTSLPEKCYGKSPLATSIKAADQLLSRVKSACDLSGQICTVPFYFVISDALTTENPPIYQKIMQRSSLNVFVPMSKMVWILADIVWLWMALRPYHRYPAVLEQCVRLPVLKLQRPKRCLDRSSDRINRIVKPMAVIFPKYSLPI